MRTILLSAIGMASVALGQQTLGVTPSQTERLEQKIISDLTSMIHEYDFSSVFSEALTEEQARQIAWQAEYKPSVNELLKKLQEALKDEAQIEQMWPDARMRDKEMFSHLNLSLDLTDDKIKVETAAKDYHGVPIYQYVYDIGDKVAVEITNIDEQGIREEQIVAPTTTPVIIQPTVPVPVATEISAIEPASASEVSEAGEENEEEWATVLTPEEQREVAFKVIAFFIMLICASFALLYIYHRCSQSKAQHDRQKKTFFEFLAGQMDDQYPVAQPYAASTTRYQL